MKNKSWFAQACFLIILANIRLFVLVWISIFRYPLTKRQFYDILNCYNLIIETGG